MPAHERDDVAELASDRAMERYMARQDAVQALLAVLKLKQLLLHSDIAGAIV